MEKLRAFLKRKDIVFSAKRYFIDAMSQMALGLFSSLIIGLIISQLSKVSIYFYAQYQSWLKLYAHNRQSFLSRFVAFYEISLFT